MDGITTSVLPDIKLRLDIEYPGYEETYCFGYECALAGMSEEENPYNKKKSEHDQWLEGWWAGYLGEEPLFRIEGAHIKEEIKEKAANDHDYHSFGGFMVKVFNIASVVTATVVIGYQILDLVA